MNTLPRIAGAILAGGQSRRMGRDKATLSLGGQTLLAHAQQLLAESGFEPVLLCGDRSDALTDRFPGLGPLAGIDSALQHLLGTDVQGVVFIPVDMPLLDVATLQQLARTGINNGSVVHFNAHPLPLYCPVTPATAACCEQLLHDDNPRQRALHVFEEAADAVVLAADKAAAKLDNINTPEDWQRLLAAHKDTP